MDGASVHQLTNSLIFAHYKVKMHHLEWHLLSCDYTCMQASLINTDRKLAMHCCVISKSLDIPMTTTTNISDPIQSSLLGVQGF